MKREYLISIVIVIIILVNSCKSEKKEFDQKDALRILLNNQTLRNTIKNNFVIYNKFSEKLSDTVLLMNLKSFDFITKNDFKLFEQQDKQFKGKSIYDFLDHKYRVKLVADVNPHDSVKFFIELSTPLFTKDKSHFIVFVITIMKTSSDYVWAENYFIFGKKNENWKLIGLINSK